MNLQSLLITHYKKSKSTRQICRIYKDKFTMGTPGLIGLERLENGENESFEGYPSEGLDEKAKKLWKDCQYHIDGKLEVNTFEAFLDTLETLQEHTLKKSDKNGRNVFHSLLYEEQTRVWNTKCLDTESRAKVVAIIKAICRTFPKQVIGELMKQQDTNRRTPLHYAAFLDINDEEEESNVTLAILLNGGDSTLFMSDKNQDVPVHFIGTSNLKTLLDTKRRIEGPIKHKDCVLHVDASIFNPPNDEGSEKTFEYLEMLGLEHKDLFDHPVITAIIW